MSALTDAVAKFQKDSGLFVNIPPEAIVAGLPNLRGPDLNFLSPELKIQAINIFGLAKVPLPGGIIAPPGDLGPYKPGAMAWTSKDGVNFLRDPDINYNAEGITMSRLESMQDGSGTQLPYSYKGSDLWNILHGRWRQENELAGVISDNPHTEADRAFWWDMNNMPTFANWARFRGNGPPQFPRVGAPVPVPDPTPTPGPLTEADRAYWWNADGSPTPANWEQFGGSGPPQFPG